MTHPFRIGDPDDAAPGKPAMTREEMERGARGGEEAAVLALSDVLDTEGRHDEALALLSTAASRGSAEAMGRVGTRLFLGYKIRRMPAEGVGLIADGARAGSASAAVFMATLAGYGVAGPQSWDEALDWLLAAAERGSRHARGQLAVLSGDRALAADARAADLDGAADFWRRLRSSVDLASLTAPPPARTLCEAPAIRSYQGLASPETCDWLIARAAPRLERAKLYDPSGLRGVVGQSRTNSIGAFYLHEIDLVQLLTASRMAAAAGVPLSHMEAPAALHYATGQSFDDHYDFVDPATPNYQQIIAREGERAITFLIYLNDDYDGGETAFPKLDISHKGVRGEGLLFTNALPGGGPDLRALHAGRPPTSGEKWIASQFIRNRPFFPDARA